MTATVTLEPPQDTADLCLPLCPRRAEALGIRHAALCAQGGSTMRLPQLDRKGWILLATFAGLSVFAGGRWNIALAAWFAPADAYGRVLNYADSFDGTLEQDVHVPVESRDTVFAQVGDAFGWAAILAAAVVAVGTWVKAHATKTARKERVIRHPVTQ